MITSKKNISCFLQGCHFSTEIFYDCSLVSYRNFETFRSVDAEYNRWRVFFYTACVIRLLLGSHPFIHRPLCVGLASTAKGDSSSEERLLRYFQELFSP